MKKIIKCLFGKREMEVVCSEGLVKFDIISETGTSMNIIIEEEKLLQALGYKVGA